MVPWQDKDEVDCRTNQIKSRLRLKTNEFCSIVN